jgi:hypothetical protein
VGFNSIWVKEVSIQPGTKQTSKQWLPERGCPSPESLQYSILMSTFQQEIMRHAKKQGRMTFSPWEKSSHRNCQWECTEVRVNKNGFKEVLTNVFIELKGIRVTKSKYCDTVVANGDYR